MNFCVAILILKMEINKQHFWHIMFHHFKKGKNAPETQKKTCTVYGEGAVTDRLDKGVKSGLQSFILEISCWRMLHNQVDQLKLIELKLRH